MNPTTSSFGEKIIRGMHEKTMWFLNKSDTNPARWIEAGNFGVRKKRNCTIHIAKTKALISFTVSAKLICAFVLAYAECWFSPDAAHIMRFSIVEYSGTQ